AFLIHRAGWAGGQHGWASLTLTIFGSGGCGGRDWRAVLQSGGQTIRGCRQHGRWMGATATRDRQRGAGQDGWSPAEGDFRRTPRLAVTEDQAGLHFARPGRRTCRAWTEGRLPFGVGVRPC